MTSPKRYRAAEAPRLCHVRASLRSTNSSFGLDFVNASSTQFNLPYSILPWTINTYTGLPGVKRISLA